MLKTGLTFIPVGFGWTKLGFIQNKAYIPVS
jgi:hypothetical protein